jgi:Big-like domain-containing protein
MEQRAWSILLIETTMKTESTIPIRTLFLKMTVLTCLAFSISFARATETIWSGPTTNFVQGASAPGDQDVLIPGFVAIKRQPGSYLYNPIVEGAIGDGTPSDTEWAFGTMANHSSLTYEPFSQIHADGQALGQHMSTYLTSGPMVMHLINEDIYISVTFTNWPTQGSTFTYLRSTPGSVAPPTPSVTITNPVNGAVFADPANVTIAANATVSSGTITNVAFFRDSTLIGSKQTPPFTITANGLTSGNYVLKAVATAAGVSATSSDVNISVVTPVTTSLSAVPATVANNQFTFSYSATPGLRYEVDVSSNLINWRPFATNVAASSLVLITNNISGNGSYFRVGRMPNP